MIALVLIESIIYYDNIKLWSFSTAEMVAFPPPPAYSTREGYHQVPQNDPYVPRATPAAYPPPPNSYAPVYPPTTPNSGYAPAPPVFQQQSNSTVG